MMDIFKGVKQPIMRGNTMKINKVITLRSDSSLPLDQIVKLIHTDKTIEQGNKCSKDFTCAGYHCRHVRSHRGEKPYECTQCGKAFHFPVISNIIKEDILERSLMNVINVLKPLQITLSSKAIKQHILERNLKNAINVQNLFTRETSPKTKEDILQRDLMNITNVVKAFSQSSCL